jgi:hypothetical protein
MSFLEPTPQGFSGAVDAAAKLDLSQLQALVSCAVQNTECDFTAFKPASKDEITGLVNAMKHIVLVGAKDMVDSAMFSQALTKAGFKYDATAALSAYWDKKGSKLGASHAAAVLKLPQLEAIDWKLGVSMASSTCSALSTAFVTLEAKIREEDGTLSSTAFELSLGEFERFAESWQQIGQQMEASSN